MLAYFVHRQRSVSYVFMKLSLRHLPYASLYVVCRWQSVQCRIPVIQLKQPQNWCWGILVEIYAFWSMIHFYVGHFKQKPVLLRFFGQIFLRYFENISREVTFLTLGFIPQGKVPAFTPTEYLNIHTEMIQSIFYSLRLSSFFSAAEYRNTKKYRGRCPGIISVCERETEKISYRIPMVRMLFHLYGIKDVR